MLLVFLLSISGIEGEPSLLHEHGEFGIWHLVKKEKNGKMISRHIMGSDYCLFHSSDKNNS